MKRIDSGADVSAFSDIFRKPLVINDIIRIISIMHKNEEVLVAAVRYA